MDKVYYQDELRYLRDVGPAFADAHPEIARYLKDPGSDPDVERLLEGVAFLCGRIRHKLDDELPEVTSSLISLLWPHFLRPIPSMSIVEFLPTIDSLQGPFPISAGIELASIRIRPGNDAVRGERGTPCRYRLCWPMVVNPWRLASVSLHTPAGEPPALSLEFETASKSTLKQLDLSRVRLHLDPTEDPRAAFTLYWLLSAHVLDVSVNDQSPLTPGESDKSISIQQAGLDVEDAVLHYSHQSFQGYRLIQEYFAHKNRFLFIDIAGLDAVVESIESESRLALKIRFNQRLESYPQVGTSNVRLHCAPIINLFEQPADPIRDRHDRKEHLIQPSMIGLDDRRHAEVYDVSTVSIVEGGNDQEIPRFYSFEHTTRDPRKATYFNTNLRPNVIGGDPRQGTDTYISFVHGRPASQLTEQTLSIELTCTNRDLPTFLRQGDIREPTDSSPAEIAFRNICKPTPTISPPFGRDLQWRLIAHMSLNYSCIASVDDLRALLKVYDFQSAQDERLAFERGRTLDGIKSVSVRYAEHMIRGALARGVNFTVVIDEDHFAGEGDAYLFSTILDRFFSIYVSLNSFSRLTVVFDSSGREYNFAPHWGDLETPAKSRAVV